MQSVLYDLTRYVYSSRYIKCTIVISTMFTDECSTRVLVYAGFLLPIEYIVESIHAHEIDSSSIGT